MSAPDRVHRFGPFLLDVADRRLRRDGVELAVQARAFDVLTVLVERAGRLVTKDELLDAVWSELAVEENNLQVQVSALRRLLGPGWIATVPGRGYRFTAVGGAAPAPQPATPELAARATGVPEPATPLIGRDDDVARVRAALAASRLVSIVGPGGVGKTRLAQAVARAAGAGFADGRAWIDLAAIGDPGLAVAGTAAALGIAVGGDAADAVVEGMAPRAMLLVFDNAEHVVEALGPFLGRLLARAPGVRALVTSQVPCRVAGEHVHRLGALELPDPGASPARAAESPAVALFTARARALVGDFQLDAANVGAVVEICRTLDGVPLALELAAGRLPALGFRALSSRLGQRFRLLTAGDRAGPPRQQTLEALFDWSYGLLSAEEQAVFRRVGLLEASFPIEDAIAVATDATLDEWSVVEILGDLVDRSLVMAGAADPPVYSLLDSGRAYARSRLDPAADGAHVERAIGLHRERALAAAARSENAAALRASTAALELVARLPEGAARDARELDLALALGPVIQTTIGPAHPRAEAVYRRATRLAGELPPGEPRFMALWGLWQFLCMAGRDREAEERAGEIVRLAAEIGDESLVLEAHHARLTTAQLLGDAPQVVEHAARVTAGYDRERHRALGFRFGGHDPGVCALGQGAVGLWLVGRADEAAAMAERALALGLEVGHAYSHAVALFYAAIAFQARGDRARFRETAESLHALSAQHAMDMLSNEALLLRGRARWEAGEAAGIADMERALDTIDAGGDFAFAIYYATLLAEALLDAGRIADAERRLARVDEYAREGQRFFLPEAWRLRGEALAAAGRGGEAERCFAEAVRVAGDCGAAALAARVEASRAVRATPGAPGEGRAPGKTAR